MLLSDFVFSDDSAINEQQAVTMHGSIYDCERLLLDEYIDTAKEMKKSKSQKKWNSLLGDVDLFELSFSEFCVELETKILQLDEASREEI